MAIGTPSLLANVGATATSATTGSITPTANALVIALGTARTIASVAPTISDSLGGTWTLVTTSDIHSGAISGSLYYQVASASPSAMTVTATSTGATQTSVSVIEITGADTDFSNFQTNFNAAGDPSVTMAAFAGTSICIGFTAQNAGTAPTGPNGYTSLFNSLDATNLRQSCFYDTSSPDTTLAWVSTGTDTIGYGWEIKESGAAPPVVAEAIAERRGGAGHQVRLPRYFRGKLAGVFNDIEWTEYLLAFMAAVPPIPPVILPVIDTPSQKGDMIVVEPEPEPDLEPLRPADLVDIEPQIIALMAEVARRKKLKAITRLLREAIKRQAEDEKNLIMAILL